MPSLHALIQGGHCDYTEYRKLSSAVSSRIPGVTTSLRGQESESFPHIKFYEVVIHFSG